MKKKYIKYRKDNAVTAIISVLLLISITIAVFVILHTFIMGDSGPEVQQTITLSGKLVNNNYIVEHCRGPSLDLESTCIIDIGGISNKYSIRDLLSPESKENNLWNIGERLIYNIGDITYFKTTISIIDNEKKSVIYEKIIQDGEINLYPYIVLTLDPTDLEIGSANLWLGYNFRNYSGSIRFSYKEYGGNWINTSWIPKSGSGIYNETINGLFPNKIYFYKAQLICNSNVINGEEKIILQDGITSINNINPYEIPLSPLDINATGPSDLDSVALWYRYCDDNVSWDTNWWQYNWKYRKLITIDSSKVADNHINFPMLFYEPSDSELATFAQNDGDDIVFILYSDNSTRLNHEIETFNGTTGNIIAWVKLNSISSTADTRIWMYFGNPNVGNQENAHGVWDSNFVAVWHLNEKPNDDIFGHFDSTSNNNHGVPKNFQDGGGGTTDAIGKIGGAVLFAGDDDWIEIPHNTSLIVNGNELALSAWVKMTSPQDNDEGIIIKSDGSNYNMHLGVQGNEKGNFRVKTLSGDTYLTGATTLQVNQWYYLYGVYNGITSKIYLRNFEDGSTNTNGNIVSPVAPVVIGRRALGDNRFFEGVIDEARISYNTQSPEWFITEYNNQNSPSTFYSIGGTEEYSIDWTKWNNTNNPDTQYPWRWNFTFLHGEGYYQFYSIGIFDEYEEEPPENPDAYCLYNAPRVVDSFEFTFEYDTDKGKYPSIIHITGDIYAIAYSGDGDDGYLKTVEINPSGTITQSVIDVLIFDIDKGLYPKITQISGNVYCIAYTGDGDDGTLKTVRIDATGDILDTVLDTYEYDTDKGKYPSIIHITGDIYAIAYSGDSDDGYIITLNIATDGKILQGNIDTFEYETDKGLNPSIIDVFLDIYAIAFCGDGDDGYVKTIEIESNGDIT
jgi:hypothetical protein